MIIAELFAKLGLVPDEKSWDKGHQLVEGLRTAIVSYLGYEGLKKVGELVEGTVEAAVAAKHLGEQLGTTGEAIQELGYAADVSGASTESMQVAMQRLAFSMQQAKRSGSGPLVEGLAQLHVQFGALKNLPLDQQLGVIADGFAKAGPHVNKTGIAMELFGREGARLIPLLNKGQAGIAELRAEAEKLGVVIDEDGIEKAEEFEIAQKKLGATLKGIRNEAVIALLPALQDMAEGLREWIAENREAIVSTLSAVLHGLAIAFRVVGAAISEVTDFFHEHWEVAQAIIIALGALITAFAVQAAIDWVIAFWPLVLIGVAIAGIILLVKNFGAIWGWLKEKALEAWEWVLRKGIEVWDWLKELPGAVEEWFEYIAQTIKDAFTDAWDFAVKKAKEAWKEIKENTGLGKLEHAAGAVGAAVGSVVYGKDDRGHIGEGYDKVIEGGSPSVAAPSNGGAKTVVQQSNDIDINVNGTNLSPDQLKAAVGGAVDDALKDVHRQAYNNLSGGKR